MVWAVGEVVVGQITVGGNGVFSFVGEEAEGSAGAGVVVGSEAAVSSREVSVRDQVKGRVENLCGEGVSDLSGDGGCGGEDLGVTQSGER